MHSFDARQTPGWWAKDSSILDRTGTAYFSFTKVTTASFTIARLNLEHVIV